MDEVKAYLQAHWDGEHPLWRAFWINGVLVSIVVTYILFMLLFSRGPDGIPTASGLGLAIYSLISGALGVWVNIGIWRSCKRRRDDFNVAGTGPEGVYGSVFWPNVVQWLIMIMLGISFLSGLTTANFIQLAYIGFIIYMLVKIGR